MCQGVLDFCSMRRVRCARYSGEGVSLVQVGV